MTVVVDANILIAFVVADEPLHTQAKQLMTFWHGANEDLIAPRLFRSEITAVIRKAVYQQRLTVEQGRLVLGHVLSYSLGFYEDDDLLKEAYELAVKFNRPRAYDTQYMALAERFDCEFWTADERLVNSTQSQFRRIRWLGNH